MIKVFFPGKFQPPHLGHVITISKLLKDYEVIIGITEDKPRVMTREQVLDIFETIFTTRLTCRLIDGKLTNYKNTDNLPMFDILVSGNDEVIDWGLKMGLPVKKVSRTEGVGFSGNELRELLKWGNKVSERSKKI